MDAERDRRYFDHWAPRYDRSLLQAILFAPTHAAALEAAAAAGARPSDVLDVGCGTGRQVRVCAPQ